MGHVADRLVPLPRRSGCGEQHEVEPASGGRFGERRRLVDGKIGDDHAGDARSVERIAERGEPEVGNRVDVRHHGDRDVGAGLLHRREHVRRTRVLFLEGHAQIGAGAAAAAGCDEFQTPAFGARAHSAGGG